jgi:ACT domain-containing protein
MLDYVHLRLRPHLLREFRIMGMFTSAISGLELSRSAFRRYADFALAISPSSRRRDFKYSARTDFLVQLNLI